MPARSKAQITKALSALDPPPSLLPTQSIARVDKALGHARYTCILPDKSALTADLDERFRQAVWVERGNYVLIERYGPKDAEAVEAAAKIINIAKDEKLWRKMPYWCVFCRVQRVLTALWVSLLQTGFQLTCLPPPQAGRVPQVQVRRRRVRRRGLARGQDAPQRLRRRRVNLPHMCENKQTKTKKAV
ncbi:hypothetical protein IMZ48_37545 [Candidatus Bathyarchaeota archaeon]|nr:hypothetical protein [Candidatus Bathyarchaeota archaeon]